MLEVNATNFVTAIDSNDPRQKLMAEEISEELRAISKLLKEGLQSLSSWIQTCVLVVESQPSFFEASANELNQISSHFASAYSHLTIYLQQFPHPADYGVARDIEKIIENLLRNDLAKETLCESTTTLDSWGETIHPSVEMDWSPELIQQFTQGISPVSWRTSKNLIDQAQGSLP